MPRPETASRFGRGFRDAVSRRASTGKARPVSGRDSGMHFPQEACLGNHIPFRARILGRNFPERPHRETVSRNSAGWWDALSRRASLIPRGRRKMDQFGRCWRQGLRPMSSLVAFLPNGELGVLRVPMDIANVVSHGRRIPRFEQLKNVGMLGIGYTQQFARRLLIDGLVIAFDKATLEL